MQEMIPVEAWTTIRYLHAQGKGVRSIAKEVGVARNTVRAALRSEHVPQYRRPPRPNPALAPFVMSIRTMALEQGLIGSRILRELRAQGYAGGKTALYTYLHSLAATQPDHRLTERFETPPGQQAQFDWSPYTVCIGERPVKLVAFGLTLGFSRRKHYWLSLDETQASAFEALEAGFRHFGGVPKELLVDNAKVFVADARPDHFAWNRRFLELCGHYALQPIACHPYRPRTKGKIERPFFYLEQQFLKGRTWPSFEAICDDLVRFVADDLDVQVHGTTRERPIDRFQRERVALTPLPPMPFVGTQEPTRTVSWDCLVSFAGSRYSVPWAYAGQQVWVRATQGRRLRVRNQRGKVVAEHRLAESVGSTVINPEHYTGLRAGLPKTRALLTQRFLERFPAHGWFVTGVYRQHPPNGSAHLRAILGLADLYPATALVTAFAAARQYDTYAHAFIRGLLEAGEPAPVHPASLGSQPQALVAGSELVAAHDGHGGIQADLGIYQGLLEAQR
jgi:transposase